jgi:hypothetical protein
MAARGGGGSALPIAQVTPAETKDEAVAAGGGAAAGKPEEEEGACVAWFDGCVGGSVGGAWELISNRSIDRSIDEWTAQ